MIKQVIKETLILSISNLNKFHLLFLLSFFLFREKRFFDTGKFEKGMRMLFREYEKFWLQLLVSKPKDQHFDNRFSIKIRFYYCFSFSGLFSSLNVKVVII